MIISILGAILLTYNLINLILKYYARYLNGKQNVGT